MKSMKLTKRFLTLALLANLSLGPTLASGIVQAGILNGKDKGAQNDKGAKHNKIASDLLDQLGNESPSKLVKVILQLDGKPTGQLNALLSSNGVKIKKQFANLDSFALELPLNVVNALSQFPEVGLVSVDSEVMTLGGHVAHTTGADNVRAMSADGALDGSGIGIAILDSGIFGGHTSFLDTQTGQSRILVNQDFTGEGRTDDPYGHGTHVAAAAAGNGMIAKGEYIGIAPRAKLLNLRVLNSKGVGTVSSVLSALNWLMQMAPAYNVRVVNMSLGMPAINSYKFDPLCVAVRKLVDKGIVVVAAAGNNGKNSAGQKIYGQIHAPGNEPSALTVGAVDTHGTDTRADDTIATYSSRGPTRSFWTDANGVKHYDNIIKPEISAPGNKTVFAESPNNYLLAQNPSLDSGVSSSPARKQMMLSGTSMAAPLAAGTAALMLEVNPTLTPNLVKSLMMYSAQQLASFNTFEQGAGELNVDGAVRLAKLVRTTINSSTTVGSSLLVTTPPAPQSTITVPNGTYTFSWAQGVILGQTYATGSALITKYQKVYGTGVLLGDGVLVGDSRGVLIGDVTGVLVGDAVGVLIGDTTMLSDGVLVGDTILTSNGTKLGAGVSFLGVGVLIGDGVLVGDGVLIGDGVLVGDAVGVLIGDAVGVLIGDSVMLALSSMLNGDDTTSMAIVPDDNSDYLGY